MKSNLEKTIKLEIEVEGDDNLYISDILCWLRGYLTAKGEGFNSYHLLNDAIIRLEKINKQIKKELQK